MPHYLYILRCSDGRLYTGTTHDPDRRLQEHQTGADKSAFTFPFPRRPVERVFLEAFESENDALEAEWKIKKWTRAKKEALIAGDWALVSQLAKKNFDW